MRRSAQAAPQPHPGSHFDAATSTASQDGRNADLRRIEADLTPAQMKHVGLPSTLTR